MNQVKVFREQAKLSQKELADRCGCSQPTIAAVEAGGNTNVRLAQRIAAVLGQPVSTLFPVEDEEFRPDVFGEPAVGADNAAPAQAAG